MRKTTLTILIVLIVSELMAQSSLLSPSEFLGYDLGTKFSRHHQVINYFQHLDAASGQVRIAEYGRTYENRPLIYAIITSESNFNQLDQIRTDNMIRAGMASGSIKTDIPIVWLGYNVHGNESVSTEASMKTAYELVTNRQDWLSNTVVIIDPCINPDGRDRYVNFYWQYGQKNYNPDRLSREHVEPWPSGRTNHYMFDLNRDWAWTTQKESKARIELYNQWLPHLAVDFHEQGIDEPYYFAPAAQPYHEMLTDWQRELQKIIGKNNAKWFDSNGWLYFTGERFDLLYPSYGDTYPSFSGAIGMTYEQGGSGRAGLGVITALGDTLSLVDRIAHHYTSGLSTVEVAFNHKERILREFTTYYSENGRQAAKTYIIKSPHGQIRNELIDWFDLHGIEVTSGNTTKPIRATAIKTGASANTTITSKDLVVSANQPKWRFARALFERNAKLADSLTYDITAWSIPFAFELEAYETTASIGANERASKLQLKNDVADDSYAIFAKRNSVASMTFLAQLIKMKIKVRTNLKPFVNNGERYDRGAIIITKRGNESFGNGLNQIVNELANRYSVELTATNTGLSSEGIDLGSSWIEILDAPKIALVSGRGTRSLDVGATWYFMEHILDYPFTMLDASMVNAENLSSYDVLILQNGRYSNFDEGTIAQIGEWVNAGGRVVAVQGALGLFRDRDGYSLKKFKDDAEKRRIENRSDDKEIRFEDQQRSYISESISGAIFKVAMDNSHPLAFGYGNEYYTLKTDSRRTAQLESGWNVGTINSKYDKVSGFAGSETLNLIENSLVFGSESIGDGTVIYMADNPLYRAFWKSGHLIFANALFYVD